MKTEPFYLASFDEPPPVVTQSLTAEEAGAYLTHAWLHPDEIAALPDLVEPPGLLHVLADLLRP